MSVDERRDDFHTNWVKPSDVGVLLQPSSYKLDIIEALKKLDGMPYQKLTLKKLSKNKISHGPIPKYAIEGIPCLRTKNIASLIIDYSNIGFVSVPFYSNIKNKHSLKINDILITRSGAGSIGRVSIFLRPNFQCITNEHLVKIRIYEEGNDPAYVALFLTSSLGERLLMQGISGSTGQLNLGNEHLRNLKIPLPAKTLQSVIGNKVRKAERLEELAQIQFNLAKDKLYECTAMEPILGAFAPYFWIKPSRTLDRLDSWPYQPKFNHLIHLIKSTYKIRTIGDISDVIKKKASLEEKNVSRHYVEINDIDISSGKVINFLTLPGKLPSGPKLIVKAGDILISKVRPNRGAITILPTKLDLSLATSGFCQIRVSGESFEKYYVWYVLRQNMILHQLDQWSSGSTYPTIEDDYIKNRVIIPWKEKDERKFIGEICEDALAKQYLSDSVINEAKSDVENFIEGNHDEAKLLAESEEIEQWLKENPSPYVTS